MANQPEKNVPRPNQFLRVQKEEDEEMWISGEELRTEGSSDEDIPRRRKSSKKLRRKRSSECSIPPEHRVSLPDINKNNKVGISIKCTSGDVAASPGNAQQVNYSYALAEYLLPPRRKDKEDEKMDEEKPEGSRPMTGASCDFDELEGAVGGDDLFEDEDDDIGWRPKRGSLKLPSLVEGDDIEDEKTLLDEINAFYGEMSSKLKQLKDCSVLNRVNTVDDTDAESLKLFEDKRLFKHLKNTPQVQDTLKMISQLDDDISEKIAVYKKERMERLEVQSEVCAEICSDQRYNDRNTNLFLQLCSFEASIDREAEPEVDNSPRGNRRVKPKSSKGSSEQSRHNFILRNIQQAKRGLMSNYSLTDEEKQRLELILSDPDNMAILSEPKINQHSPHYPYSIPSVTLRSEFANYNGAGNLTMIENLLENDCDQELILNAFQFCDDDKRRLVEIDKALQDYPGELHVVEQMEAMELPLRTNVSKHVAFSDAVQEIDSRMVPIANDLGEVPSNISPVESKVLQKTAHLPKKNAK